MSKKDVLIIYTGGTVGMKNTPKGYLPVPGFLESQMRNLTEFQHPDMPNFTLLELTPLLDSSDMDPISWHKIGMLITKHYAEYDGFIVIHGTDTMAYTASALSFMLNNLGKPVIFTGSQVPLAEVHTDARENLLVAILLAANDLISEVCIYFNNQLLRGNRTRKVDSMSANAFASPNYLPLGNVGTEIKIYDHQLLPKPTKALELKPIESHKIVCCHLSPGLDFKIIEHALDQPLDAVVLVSFGAGNAPIHNAAFMHVIERTAKRNILVANTTQCLTGGINMHTYENGRVLADAGVISTQDMTIEAILCKLHYLFSHHSSEASSLLPKNMRGELS